MAYTASTKFLSIQDKINTAINNSYQSASARKFIDSRNRIEPYDNYTAWLDSNKKYEFLVPFEDYIDDLNDILKLQILYDYADGDPGITIPTSLQVVYYDSGIVLIDVTLSGVPDITAFLLDYITLTRDTTIVDVNTALNTVAANMGLPPLNLRPLSIHAGGILANDYLNKEGLNSCSTIINSRVSTLTDGQLTSLLGLWSTNRPNRTRYLVTLLSLTETDLKCLIIDLIDRFEHWIFTIYSPNLDAYLVQTFTPIVYTWLQTADELELISVLNEWNQVPSLAVLAKNLNDSTAIGSVITVLRDPPVPFGISTSEVNNSFNHILYSTTKFEGIRLLDAKITDLENTFGNISYKNNL